ncbi:MAG: N-acetyl-D-Glu racemase DgcA [Hyphomicrobiaceae bacterium]
MRRLEVVMEHWPIAGEFRISRGAKREAVVVVATIRDGSNAGRGECTPYARYGETVDGVLEAILSVQPDIASGLDRQDLLDRLPAGAARNAIDCALLDLEARQTGRSVSALLGMPVPERVLTCYTLSLAEPADMARQAEAQWRLPLLKLKLGAPGDADRMREVRKARPEARLVADANEGWSETELEHLLAVAAECGFETIEQPLPAGADGRLGRIVRPLAVTADESVHVADDLEALRDRYDGVNLKLDKAGGLTAAVEAAHAAISAGLDIMVGSMVATSLAMAPALHLAGVARWVDLDGPLLLARDRSPHLVYEGAWITPASRDLWG